MQSPAAQSSSAKEALRHAVISLQQAHIESASLDARVLLSHALGMNREELLLSLDATLAPEQEAAFRELIIARAARQPVAQLVGQREFFGLPFTVTPATLDPRPDSETLIEALMQRFPDRAASPRILDLGTGTGCLLLTLLAQWPNATGTGVDISTDALEVGKENALHLGLEKRAAFTHSNWFEKVEGRFDIIIANPPYIPSDAIGMLAPEVARFEPKLALDGGADGLDCYRAILKTLPDILAEGGIAAFEIGAGQEHSLTTFITKNRLQVAGSRQDLQGIVRCILIQHPTHQST